MPGVWSPINISWGVENRTAAIRAIRGAAGGSTRTEYRLSGADVNPYLAMAACLASGLYGIEHGVELPPPVSGNAADPNHRTNPRPCTRADLEALYRAAL